MAATASRRRPLPRRRGGPRPRRRPQGHPADRHRRLGRRRQEHADRPAALRQQGRLRGPVRGGRAGQPGATTSTSRCSPTACAPSASRASPSTSPTATSRTPRRTFILADTPGHVQYTRNMVTGASTADLAIVLVDARKGMLEQSRRHAFLASLLRVPHLVVAVNKMDLVDWSEETYEAIRDEFTAFAAKLDVPDLTVVPISALHGDNVVTRSANIALVRRPVAAAPPRARARGQRPQPGRHPVPGAVRDPAAVRRLPRLPRLRGHGRQRRAAARRRGAGAAQRADHDDRRHRRPPRPGRRGVRADVGDRPADRRPRRLPRRPDLPAGATPRTSPRTSTRWSAGWPTSRCAPRQRLAVKHTTRTVRGDGQGAAVPARRQHAAPRPRGRASSASTTSAGCGCAPPSRCSSTTTPATGSPAGSSSSTRRPTPPSAPGCSPPPPEHRLGGPLHAISGSGGGFSRARRVSSRARCRR